MRIIGIGIDIVSIKRIRTLLVKGRDTFTNKVFTPNEQAYCAPKKKKECHYAGRFAAKEAVMKAAGTGWSGAFGWLNIEISNGTNGKLSLTFLGKGKATAKKLGVTGAFVSISHTDDTAIAEVMLVGK